MGKKDLGIYIEMFIIGIMKFIKVGVVNGVRKNYMLNKYVVVFVYGI